MAIPRAAARRTGDKTLIRRRRLVLGLVLGLVLVGVGGLPGCAGSQSRPPQLIVHIGPEYPQAARSAGVQGQVTLEYSIGLDGAVSNLLVVQAEPAGVFEQVALAAVRQWRYKPPLVQGVPRAADKVRSTLKFVLDDDSYAGYE